jgi:hypothetical protein
MLFAAAFGAGNSDFISLCLKVQYASSLIGIVCVKLNDIHSF